MEQLKEEIKDKKTYFLNLEYKKEREILDEDPLNIFELTFINKDEEQVIFVDEIQLLKDPSNFLKLLYDMFHKNMKLVVSGSSSFYIDQKFKDSLM
jgi:predicted AAA+ superfamily ATPase